MDTCKIITLLGATVSLILAVVILSKVNKKGWCSEGFSHISPKSKGMVLKSATQACGYLGDSSDPYGDYGNVYPCGQWANENKKGGNCTVGNSKQPCEQPGDDGMYGPLGCCEAICGDSSYKKDPTVMCSDPNAG